MGKYKYNQKLPKKVEKKLDDFLVRIKKIPWFSPSPDLKKSDIDKLVKVSLKAFGVKAGIEYRTLKTKDDRDSAWASARASARAITEILVEDLDVYEGNKAFLSLIDIWEKGLYPIGVIGGKFIVYVPPCSQEFPDDLI